MKFDDIVDEVLINKDPLSEDWKSAVAAGLVGLGTAIGSPTKAQAAQTPSITQSVENKSLSKLLDALETVESNGNVNAIGDNGKAKGILQIWDVVIKDVNRVYKTKYKHNDAFDRVKSRDIAKKYLTYWGKQYTKETGNAPTYEVFSRLWNGGPKGYEKDSTIKYWNRVKKYLT